ncbi:MAG: flagellar export protein FliJ [Gemmatimonadota bacterium]
MTPKFSLQRVLELKERREQTTALRLAEARMAAETAKETEEAIESLRASGVSKRAAVGGGFIAVGQLQNAAYLIDRLDQKLEEARTAYRHADAQVKERLTEFTDASRERQVLDRLKEKKRDAALLEQADLDRKTMDAIALSRFVRTDKPSQGSRE